MKLIGHDHCLNCILVREVTSPRRIALCQFAEQGLSQEKSFLKWQEELYRIRDKISKVTTNQQKYNFAVLNYYRDGRDYIGAHSDNLREYEPGTVIASLSLGSERHFVLQHKNTNSKTSIVLEHGSLLLMEAECQKYYKHSIPKRLKVTNGRINITFRFIRREEKSSIY
jgi:alkylated DNA repair dioxygenase AlkB